MKTNIFLKGLVGLLIYSSRLCAAVLAYVSNTNSQTVSVIDTTSDTVIATIPVGFFPMGIDHSPDGSTVYLTLFSDDTIQVIDTSTNTLVSTASLEPGAKPIAIATSPNGYSYIANFSNATYSTLDPVSWREDKKIPLGAIFPINLAIKNDGTHAYIVNAIGPNNVKVINLSNDTITKSMNSGQQSFGIAITPDDSLVYVTNPVQSTITVFSTALDIPIASIPLAAGSFPRGIKIRPDSLYAYVANQGTSSVAVIDISTQTVTTTISLTANLDPYHIAFTPDGSKAYVTQTLGNSVSVIDTVTNTEIGTIPVGTFPYDVTIVTTP